MKKKLWLMGICFSILLLIFATNIYKQLKEDKASNPDNQDMILREGDMITVKESLLLFNYLGISKDKFGQTEGEGDKNLSFLEGRTFFEVVCKEFDLDLETMLAGLTFDMEGEPDNKAMLSKEFLTLYENLLGEIPEDKITLIEKTLFVLGIPEGESSKDKDSAVITDQGEFTFKGLSLLEDFTQIKDYIDCKLVAMVKDNEIVYTKAILEEETILHNVFIASGSESTLSVFLNDMSRDFKTKYKLSQEIEGEIGDLVIKNKEIIKISIKPDSIGGKVLVANQDFIEIEGYGRIDLDEFYKIYKVYDELSMEVTNSILVGYDATDFVVADGKIVAALIKESIKAQNIRVLIKTDKFTSIFHEKIQLTADKDFTITAGDIKKSYKAGEKITIKPTNKLLKEGRLLIETESESGKIQLLSLNRQSPSPTYRGTMEIVLEEEGLIIINELSIEEYLYAVIPSEMPTSYGAEALKVQAVCARSYAYNQLLANGYREYGAHVDDSVSYQVYNNIAENEASILAVKDTYGKVIKYEDAVVTAYYFSTSCGVTASLNEVWINNEKAQYLVGKAQTVFDVVEGEVVETSTNAGEGIDFSKEKAFRSFLNEKDTGTYDSEFAWYRWSVTISKENLKKSIDKSLGGRYNANPALIQTLVAGKVDDNPKYESKSVSSVGAVKDILIGRREKSGLVSEILIVGSDCTIKVQTEYNIRTLLAPLWDEVVRQDDSTTSGLSMLPSAFLVMDKESNSITFIGGGYGHGVGMSQNGAKAMADSGKDYETIIKHYYTGIELGFIY